MSNRRFSHHFRKEPMSGINVTPFVDVMLVLLIVFMITAPLLAVGIIIRLPEGEAKNIETNYEPLIVSLSSEGDIYLGNDRIDAQNLTARLLQEAKDNFNYPIFLRGDKMLAYGRVIEIMSLLRKTGFTSVALITKSEPD